MTMTAEAMWLNSVFAGYDNAILSFAHKLAEIAGVVLTPLFKLISLLGEGGIFFFLLAVILILFPRWRKTGVCIFGAVCCGALITNILLKDHIARLRPFEASELYRQWWQFIGSPAEERCDLGPADDVLAQLSDGSLSFRRAVRHADRCVLRFRGSMDHAADFPRAGKAQRREPGRRFPAVHRF